MTDTLTIRRFQARYHLRPSQFDQRDRLNRLIPQVTGDALEMALDRVGISPSEVVCIRSLNLLIRLQLSRTDSSLVQDWAELLANAIAAALTNATVAVRYRTRSLALIDMGAKIAQQRFELAWAWRQAGFWDSSGNLSGNLTDLAAAADQFTRALTREPEFAIPVLVALAAQGLLDRLAHQWNGEAWLQIAAAVMQSGGSASQAILSEIATPVPADEQHLQSLQAQGPSAMLAAQASRIIEQSRILANLPIARMSPNALHAAILLAVLEVEPSLLRAPPSRLIDLVRTVFERVHELPTRLQTRQGIEDRSPKASPPFVAPPAIEPVTASKAISPNDSSKTPLADQSVAPEYRTAFGGLLFLLRLEDILGVPVRALEFSPVTARGLQWFQHRLALALQPLEPDDPAALAFCGLPPQAPHPSLDQPSPSPAEQDFINGCVTDLSAALREALQKPDENPQKLLQFVCWRRARILADPGWIDVRLDMGDLSVEIRRAGLDLDPNFIPWLGIVMRFVYE